MRPAVIVTASMSGHPRGPVIAESGIFPGDPIIMRGTLDHKCKSALCDALSESSDEL